MPFEQNKDQKAKGGDFGHVLLCWWHGSRFGVDKAPNSSGWRRAGRSSLGVSAPSVDTFFTSLGLVNNGTS